MGYRKAARLRRTQYVRGHYRTSKNGTTHYVSGHVRNDCGDSGGQGCALAGIWILCLVFAPFTKGVTLLLGIALTLAVRAADKECQKTVAVPGADESWTSKQETHEEAMARLEAEVNQEPHSPEDAVLLGQLNEHLDNL